MIQAVFERTLKGQCLSSFILTGHAESGDAGHDLVCSAVSALSISTVNSLDQLANVTFNLETNQQEGGYLSLELDQAYLSNYDAQLLFKHLLLALKSIEAQYQDNIRVIEH